MRKPLLATLLLILAAIVALPAHAAEVIKSFHADITVGKDGKLTVTETIRVFSEGYQIKRGIYRDFPLTFIGDDGEMHRVDFEFIGVERNGMPEDYKTEAIDNGIRFYFGNEDVLIPRGEHTYTFTYETGRQIRYFPKHDELFWNVTGNFWAFPIESASATVMLPKGVSPEATVFYTGRLGETGKRARAEVYDETVHFQTTGYLNVNEGLTVGVKFAKGAISPPSENDLFWWSVKDRQNSITAGICFALVFAYFALQWFRVGRDPAGGIVVPRWDPPAGLSPALVNYVANRGFSNGGWTAFSASIINLAVKGVIKLDDLKNSVTLKLLDKVPDGKLPLGEDVIYQGIRRQGTYLMINKATGHRIQELGEKFRTAIDKEHSGKYHRFNSGVITLGLLITALCFGAILMFGDLTEDMMGALIVPAFVFVFVSSFSAVLSSTALAAPVLALRVFARIFLAFFWLALVIVLIVSALAAHAIARSNDDIFAFYLTCGMILAAGFFTTIMGAATPLGRQLKDGIEGLKLYLTVAEKERMNLAGAPEMSPQHYEKLLPYAVALGVEKPWSKAFQSWLDKAGAAAAAYQPAWYDGKDFDHSRLGQRMSSFSSSLSSTISSSLPPPPESSSSGFSSSGSSGGGGGGGGGGGW